MQSIGMLQNNTRPMIAGSVCYSSSINIYNPPSLSLSYLLSQSDSNPDECMSDNILRQFSLTLSSGNDEILSSRLTDTT